MELRDAISQISHIRAQMARAERLRGLRAVPIGASGLLALAAATAQPVVAPDPTDHLLPYLVLWVGVAFLSAVTGLLEMLLRCRVSRSDLTRSTVCLAGQQFLPTVFAGAAITAVLAATAPGLGWLLPGLWQVLFGLGICACSRLVPRSLFWVGPFYLVTGTWVLSLGPAAWSPWTMGVPFGLGQLATALVLYWTLERPEAPS